MRLSCAKCGAEYEIPEQAIPCAGRDVECTNCGHIWFFAPRMLRRPEGAEPEIEEALRQVLQEQSEASAPSDRQPAKRRKQRDPSGLTPEVAAVLRQEAQYEAAVRSMKPARDEALTFETEEISPAQPDDRPEPVQAPTSQETPMETSSSPQTDAKQDRFEPEQDDATYPDPIPAQSARQGMRSWSLATLAIAIVLVGLYVFDDAVVRVIPEAKGALESYVAWVDGVFVTLSNWIRDKVPALAPSPAALAD